MFVPFKFGGQRVPVPQALKSVANRSCVVVIWYFSLQYWKNFGSKFAMKYHDTATNWPLKKVKLTRNLHFICWRVFISIFVSETEYCVYWPANVCSTCRLLVDIICFCIKTSFLVFLHHKQREKEKIDRKAQKFNKKNMHKRGDYHYFALT